MRLPVLIFGLTASGKTSQARLLSQALNIPYLSGSTMLLERLKKQDSTKTFVWLGAPGKDIECLRNKSNVDRETDVCLLDEAKRLGVFVSDSWTLPWLFKEPSIRIHLRPSLSSRCQMAHGSKTEQSIPADIEAELDKKDKTSRDRFKSLHGFDIFETSHFDMALDNAPLNQDQTSALVLQYVRFRWNSVV